MKQMARLDYLDLQIYHERDTTLIFFAVNPGGQDGQ